MKSLLFGNCYFIDFCQAAPGWVRGEQAAAGSGERGEAWSCRYLELQQLLTAPEMDVKSLLQGRVKGCQLGSERKLRCTDCTDCVIQVRMRIINLDYSLSQLI